ncbi:hypothetical protein [Nocardia asteroides]
MTYIANHTPHPVVVHAPDDTIIARFPPHPHPARIDETHTPTTPIAHDNHHLPRTLVTYRASATDLPPPHPDTILIVSRILAAAHPDRTDLVFPLHEVRDPEGNIIGCRALGSFHTP